MSNVSHVYLMASIFIVGAGELTDVSDYREHNRKPAGQDDINKLPPSSAVFLCYLQLETTIRLVVFI